MAAMAWQVGMEVMVWVDDAAEEAEKATQMRTQEARGVRGQRDALLIQNKTIGKARPTNVL